MKPQQLPDHNIRLLSRFQRLEIETARLLGGWLPGVVKWEAKRAVAGHLWEDAQHSKELRTRLWELRHPDPDRDADGSLAALSRAVRSLAAAQQDFEMVAAVYLVLKKQLAAAYRAYIRRTHQVQDAPSLPVLRRLALELEEQVRWAEGAVRELADTGDKTRGAQRWMQYAEDVLAAVGGVDGLGEAGPAATVPPGYNLLLPFPEVKRDSRFRATIDGAPQPDPADTLATVLWQFNNYVQEMQAAETLGSTLWEADGMPWEFYYDVSRHCYDEERHSLLGETRLAELGHHPSDFQHMTGNYAWRQMVDPTRRYCILTEVIEAGSFAYKREAYQKHMADGDLASAQAFLFDIIDETMHVRWGGKWVPRLMEHAGINTPYQEFVQECREITARNSFNALQRAAAAR
ncbi:MAG: DUF455 family protein [Meiothermus sp.]|nr:DUF455 family protein [Meiothermus sp.]